MGIIPSCFLMDLPTFCDWQRWFSRSVMYKVYSERRLTPWITVDTHGSSHLLHSLYFIQKKDIRKVEIHLHSLPLLHPPPPLLPSTQEPPPLMDHLHPSPLILIVIVIVIILCVCVRACVCVFVCVCSHSASIKPHPWSQEQRSLQCVSSMRAVTMRRSLGAQWLCVLRLWSLFTVWCPFCAVCLGAWLCQLGKEMCLPCLLDYASPPRNSDCVGAMEAWQSELALVNDIDVWDTACACLWCGD